MPNLDDSLGVHVLALKLQAHRGEVLATNMANADTPGFKARDIAFHTVLEQYQSGGGNGLRLTHDRHMSGAQGGPGGAELLYRTPTQPSIDGNTVDPDREKSAFLENAMNYQSTLTFLDGKFKTLKTALKGGQ